MKRSKHGILLLPALILAVFAMVLHEPRVQSHSPQRLRSLYTTLEEIPVYASESPQTASSGAKKETPSSLIPLPDGKDKETTKRICSGCHGTNTFASHGYTREKWSSVIDAMTAKGLDASDDEMAEILDYLTASFPPPPAKDSPHIHSAQH